MSNELDITEDMDDLEVMDADVLANVEVISEQQYDLSLSEFIADFGGDLMDSVKLQNPAVFSGEADVLPHRVKALNELLRKPFKEQADVVHAVTKLLIDQNEHAAIINAEMGTGKTMMGIATAYLMHYEGYKRTLVIAPPHLVYKWRREIKATIPNARVWILNGPDTLKRLLEIRALREAPTVPEFFIMGRVRMRMGFHWKPAFATRWAYYVDEMTSDITKHQVAVCSHCFRPIRCNDFGAGNDREMSAFQAPSLLSENRQYCRACRSPLWTMHHRQDGISISKRDRVFKGLTTLPTIGAKTADKLLSIFGDDLLGSMLEDNLYEFINLMDENGELVFSDRKAARMERALSSFEFSLGQGGYQPTEFIKRYLPQDYFGLLIPDEGHEYKNEGSAQGQAMGVLACKCQKILLLTGTLMGGYADDVFYLLWRLNPRSMIQDGFKYVKRGLRSAAQEFLRQHGILQDVFKTSKTTAHRTSKAKATSHRVKKKPGFGPLGIMRYILPITVFLKLKDISGNILPPYQEHYVEIEMSDQQFDVYFAMYVRLQDVLKGALRKGDQGLLGVITNSLLAWPECDFRDESVKHPRTRDLILHQPAVFDEAEVMPKEQALIERCLIEKQAGRRVLAYTIYTGTRDTSSRLKRLIEEAGLKCAVLRSTVPAENREDWVADQVDRGINVLICNPELVKTGLDLLEFPTIVFMQSGYNVYTLMQAARRSWRIGQRQDVHVYYFGYAKSAQVTCLELMSNKIAVSQSTSGDMPDCGLDILNQSGDSIEVTLAKRLLDPDKR